MLSAAHSRELCRRDPPPLSGPNNAGRIPPVDDDMFSAGGTEDIFLDDNQWECLAAQHQCYDSFSRCHVFVRRRLVAVLAAGRNDGEHSEVPHLCRALALSVHNDCA
jgi:hypothetical protein